MARRFGTRILAPASSPRVLAAADFGEDWVVPREGSRYLVVSENPDGALLTAYDLHGNLTGEQWASSCGELEDLLRELHRLGLAEPPREIPAGETSAIRWLDSAGPGT